MDGTGRRSGRPGKRSSAPPSSGVRPPAAAAECGGPEDGGSEHGERYRARLAAVLAHVPGPAFILGEDGGIVLANQRGWEHLSAEPDAFEALSRARRGGSGNAEGKRITIAPIPHPASAEVLAIVAEEGDGLAVRLAACTRQWGLTRRQAETLALAARGESNKEIAAKLGCTEATVEIHMTRIFEKSGVRTRAAAIARVWSRQPTG